MTGGSPDRTIVLHGFIGMQRRRGIACRAPIPLLFNSSFYHQVCFSIRTCKLNTLYLLNGRRLHGLQGNDAFSLLDRNDIYTVSYNTKDKLSCTGKKEYRRRDRIAARNTPSRKKVPEKMPLVCFMEFGTNAEKTLKPLEVIHFGCLLSDRIRQPRIGTPVRQEEHVALSEQIQLRVRPH